MVLSEIRSESVGINLWRLPCKTLEIKQSLLFVLLLLGSPQDIDVLAVLNFQIPCFRPETPAFYLWSLLTNHRSGTQKGRPRRLYRRKPGLQRSRTARTKSYVDAQNSFLKTIKKGTPTFGFVNQFTWLITYDSCRLWRNDYGIILLLRHHYVIGIIWIILRNIVIILLTTTLDTAIYWFYESVYMTHTIWVMSTMTQWLRKDFSIT